MRLRCSSALPTSSKNCASHRPPRRRDDLHPLHQLLGLAVAGAEHAVQLVEQRLQVAREHAVGVELLDELVHRQQRVDLALAEPHARQLVLRLRSVAGLHVELVAVGEAVVDDRRAHAVAQVLEVALQGGTRHLQLVHQRCEADAAAGADQHLDLVEALGPVHCPSPVAHRVRLRMLAARRRAEVTRPQRRARGFARGFDWLTCRAIASRDWRRRGRPGIPRCRSPR